MYKLWNSYKWPISLSVTGFHGCESKLLSLQNCVLHPKQRITGYLANNLVPLNTCWRRCSNMLGWKRGNATSNSRILILCLSRIATGSRILWTWTQNRWSRRNGTAILTAVGTTPTATGWCACCFNMMCMREIQPVPCKRASTYTLCFWYACFIQTSS